MDSFERDLTDLFPRLRRLAHALARSPAEADDLVQGAVERILRARTQWLEGTRFDAWAFRILRNLWIDTTRAQSRSRARLAPEDEGQAVGHDPRAQIEARAELMSLMQAMARLPDEQREVIALVAIDGLGYAEAAQVLGLPIGTVSTRVARGRRALAALIGGEHDGR
ncbi:RNA polymerase sigma factor [Caulobacter sp. KR2-114]|uniref:RNA polymerase sigma factor n=1 Tax=Caulobacter sp. KR2-114 TaxID=3400912 RepID=UPI003C08A2C5